MTQDLDALLDALPSCETAGPFDRLATLTGTPDRTAAELQRIFTATDSFCQKSPENRGQRHVLPSAIKVLGAIASHPNSSPAVLAQVLHYAPEEFCNNPAASLLALEDPGWPKQVSDLGLRCLLRLPNAPVSIVVAIAAGNVTKGKLRRPSAQFPLTRPTPSPIHEGGYISPRVREARDHIAIAPEIRTREEWLEAIRSSYRMAALSNWIWAAEELLEYSAMDQYKGLRRGNPLRRLSPPGLPDLWQNSWWSRLGAAEGARPLIGHSWAPSVERMLRDLAEDGHRLVRAGARFRLAEPGRKTERLFPRGQR